MSENIYQRFCVRLCQKTQETYKHTFERLLKVYREGCIGRRKDYEWFKRFKDGYESVESAEKQENFANQN